MTPAVRPVFAERLSLAARIAALCGADRVVLVGICGRSGAGKTTLCRQLGAAFPDFARHLDCDRFSAFGHADRHGRIADASRRGDAAVLAAEENPCHWYDWTAIGQALRDLSAHREFSHDRAWNRTTGALDGTYAVALPAAGPALVLCDCIYLLHAPVRQWFDVTLYVEAPLDLTVDRGWRRARDPAIAADLARLHRTYSEPYFEAHSARADWVYRSPAWESGGPPQALEKP